MVWRYENNQSLIKFFKFSSVNVTLVFQPTLSTEGLDRKSISILSTKQVKEGLKIAFNNFN